jgi:hypothetical protein
MIVLSRMPGNLLRRRLNRRVLETLYQERTLLNWHLSRVSEDKYDQGLRDGLNRAIELLEE